MLQLFWRSKIGFGRFRQGDLILNNQPRPFNDNGNALLAVVEYKMKISTEEISKSLKIDISSPFDI